MNLKKKAEQLKKDIPAIIVSLKDKETPLLAKIFAGIIIVYALSPIDLIPDFIPVLGYLDDLIILPVLIALTIRLIPESTFQRHRVEAANNGKSMTRKWFYSMPIIVSWLLLACIIVRWITF